MDPVLVLLANLIYIVLAQLLLTAHDACSVLVHLHVSPSPEKLHYYTLMCFHQNLSIELVLTKVWVYQIC